MHQETDPCYRCSYNFLPTDQSKVRNSVVPISFTVEFDKRAVALAKDDLIRCSKCSGYLNVFCEIVAPGVKWKCNLCKTINDAQLPFQYAENASRISRGNEQIDVFNRENFTHSFLQENIYEVEAPESFVVRTPDAPVLIFLIEVSIEAKRNNLLESVLNCIKEALKNNDWDKRSKACFIFYSDVTYVLTVSGEMVVIAGETPKILSDQILFSINPEEAGNIFNKVNDSEIIEYFNRKETNGNCLLSALKIPQKAFRTGTAFCFVSSMPCTGISEIKPSNSLSCTNQHYKKTAENLFKKNICVNFFLCTRVSVEFAILRILSQAGGETFHYSNFDGTDPAHTSKLFCDLSAFLEGSLFFNALARIRTSENVSLKAMHGNFVQKGPDLFAYANYSYAHCMNFELSLNSTNMKSCYIQIAMVRVRKSGMKTIRVFNISLPVYDFTGDLYEPKQIAMGVFYNACLKECQKRHSGAYFMDQTLKAIYKEISQNDGIVPDYMRLLSTFFLSLKKSVVLRPDNSTPIDFRAFYMYLFTNMQISFLDMMQYPFLANLNDQEMFQYNLSIQNINQKDIYVLDSGANIFIFIGTENMSHSDLFEGEITSGPILLDNLKENEYSSYLGNILSFLTENRIIKPRYILVHDREKSLYSDIFRSYMYDDKMYGIADLLTYDNSIEQ
ncbi:hypothetical protein NUSPORA_02276 [Nucleospora cyclopteri]